MARQYQFYELARGARFEHRGEQFTRIGMGIAEAQDRTGTIFDAATEVTVIGEVLLLPPEEEERWKPFPRWPYD